LRYNGAVRKPMPKRSAPAKRERKAKKPDPERSPPSRFAPAAFLKGTPESIQALCQELADAAKARFSDVTGTSFSRAASALVNQLRAAGHDLRSFDESEGLQEWQAEWHHPRGSFSLFLTFRAPSTVEVTWKTETQSFVGR